jgi:hypothetical protein
MAHAIGPALGPYQSSYSVHFASPEMVDAGLLRKPGDQEMRNMERQTEIGLCNPM